MHKMRLDFSVNHNNTFQIYGVNFVLNQSDYIQYCMLSLNNKKKKSEKNKIILEFGKTHYIPSTMSSIRWYQAFNINLIDISVIL